MLSLLSWQSHTVNLWPRFFVISVFPDRAKRLVCTLYMLEELKVCSRIVSQLNLSFMILASTN